jgi:hypothetical protein
MNLSNYAENLVAVWLAGGATPSALSTLYLDVHNGEPDETNTNTTSVYQLLTGTSGRKVITPTSSFFSATNDTVTNILEIVLTASAVSACTITHFSVWTAASGGNQLYRGAITGSPISVLVGNNVRFAPGSIQIVVA